MEIAIFTTLKGEGVALIPETAADVSLERTATNLTVSHNALISGRGTKQFAPPETLMRVEEAKQIAGRFTLIPLGEKWPARLERIFSASRTAPVQVERPFYHSYEQ